MKLYSQSPFARFLKWHRELLHWEVGFHGAILTDLCRPCWTRLLLFLSRFLLAATASLASSSASRCCRRKMSDVDTDLLAGDDDDALTSVTCVSW